MHFFGNLFCSVLITFFYANHIFAVLPKLQNVQLNNITVAVDLNKTDTSVTNSIKKISETVNTTISTEKVLINIDDNPIIKKIFPEEENDDISQSLQTGFFICMFIGLGAVAFVSWKAFRMRRSRAERRYGVQGDRSAQELTPLPMAIEHDDSDNEDHTVFDLSRVT